jgi:glycosyltransferase involved in cell wall biosynthesis
MDKCSLSIIVAVYNTSQFLSRCVDSILNQTFSELELILVDDGSTDDSGKICDSYLHVDERVRVVHKKNGGLISARSAGMEIAKGEYLSFVDSDDWVESDNYLKLFNQRELDADLVIGSYVIEDVDGKIFRPFADGVPRVYKRQDALLLMFCSQLFNWSGCNKLYHKSLFEEFPGWKNLNSYGEDTELNWYMFNHARKICYTSSQGYHYCINQDSMMHKPFHVDMMAYMDRMSDIFDEIENENSFLCHAVANLTVEFALDKFVSLIKNVKDGCLFARYYSQLERFLPYVTFLMSKRQKKILVIAAKGLVGAKSFFKEEENQIISQIGMLKKRKKRIFLYGAGIIAGEVIDILKRAGGCIDGVFISERKISKVFQGYEVCCFDELTDDKLNEYGFVLAMNSVNSAEVIAKLNLKNVDFVDCGKYSMNY